jgi:hypothetical protein
MIFSIFAITADTFIFKTGRFIKKQDKTCHKSEKCVILFVKINITSQYIDNNL